MAITVVIAFLLGAIIGSIVAQIAHEVYWKTAVLNTLIAPLYFLLHYVITGMVVSYRFIKRLFQ